MLSLEERALQTKVQQVQQGNREVLSELCLLYDHLVHKLAFEQPYRLLGEDGLAQARLSLIEGLYDFDPQRGVPLTAYLCGRIRQDLWQELRKRRRLWEREWCDDGSLGGVLAVEATPDDLEEDVLDDLCWADFEARLAELPVRQRRVILGLVKGLKATEIAENLHISVQAVYALRKRSQDRLKKVLFQHV